MHCHGSGKQILIQIRNTKELLLTLHMLLLCITKYSRTCMHYDWSVQVHVHPIKLEYIVIHVPVNSLE